MRTTLNIDLSQPSDPVPAGAYRVRIDAVDLREAKSSGQPCLRWKLIIQEGPYQDYPVWMWTSLSPRALWKLEKILRALGVAPQGELVTDDASGLVIEPQLSGRDAIATVEQYDLDGQTRCRACDLRADHGQTLEYW